MAPYLKDNFKWDEIQRFITNNITLKSGKISNTISRFIEMIELLKKEEDKIEAGEVLLEGPIDSGLVERIKQAVNNIRNATYYNSLLLIVFSFPEYSLTELCRILEPYIIKPVGSYHKYEEGKGIDKSKNYLRRAFDINISEQSEWSELTKYQKVRNLIAHNGSNLFLEYDKPLEEQRDYKVLSEIKKHIYISNDSGYLYISDIEYIKNLHSISSSFIQKVISQIKEQVKK